MTVQGPVKKQQPDGMSHRGGAGGGGGGTRYVLLHDHWSPVPNYALLRVLFHVFYASSRKKSQDVSITILYIVLLIGTHGWILGPAPT